LKFKIPELQRTHAQHARSRNIAAKQMKTPRTRSGERLHLR